MCEVGSVIHVALKVGVHVGDPLRNGVVVDVVDRASSDWNLSNAFFMILGDTESLRDNHHLRSSVDVEG